MRRLVNYLFPYSVFVLAAVFPSVLSAQGRGSVHATYELVPSSSVVFPRQLGLERRWKAFLTRPKTPKAVAALLEDDLHGAQLVPWGNARYTSLWAEMQRKLAADPKIVALLRESQERDAQGLVEDAAESLDKLMLAARRFPWTEAIQRALLTAGSRELRRGNIHFAWHCFQDVLERSADAQLRTRAQVGLWLAAAHAPNEGMLEMAFQGISPQALFPWMGKEISVAEIQRRLTRPATSSPCLTLKELARKTLEVPQSSAKIAGAHGEGIAVASSDALYWYDGKGDRLLWCRKFPVAPGNKLWASLVRGPVQPAVADRKIYSRCGIQSLPEKQPGFGSYGFVTSIAAFDVQSGGRLWSTSSDPELQDLCPVNDPTLAEGRLFFLAVLRDKEFSPIYLVCLDAESGSFLWKRELASNHTIMGAGNAPAPDVQAQKTRQDVVHYGNAVTVAKGSVYCLTNMGVVACCDARDGVIEWVRAYPQDSTERTFRRPGAAPVVIGRRVVFLPRDASLTFALDAANGSLSWLIEDDDTLAVLGTVGQSLILAGGRTVSALWADTGLVRWEQHFPETISDQVAAAGNALYVGTRNKLHRLNAQTGQVVERQSWGKTKQPRTIVCRDNTLFGIVKGGKGARLPAPADLSNLAGRQARVVYRRPSTLYVDGHPTEWGEFPTFVWEDSEGWKGKALLTQDDRNLYIGLTIPGGWSAHQQLDLSFKVGGGQVFNWRVAPDGRGGVAWDDSGHPLPANTKAAAHEHLLDGSLTFELSIPLAPFLSTKHQEELSRGRFSLQIALSSSEPQSSPLVCLSENLSLHRLTREQEAAGLKLGRAFLDRDASWQFLEQCWRLQASEAVTAADFYRGFIKNEPRSAAVSTALVRLDRALRKDSSIDPSSDILEFAAEAGVPAPVRAWYKKVSSTYLSQWVYLDSEFLPRDFGLELYDGLGRNHRLAAVDDTEPSPPPDMPLRGIIDRRDATIPFDARTALYLSGEALETALETAGRKIFPMPSMGAWQNIRIPLIWIGMHDQPIRGIAFSQRGGSSIYWDRTVLVVDGKESVLVDHDQKGGIPLGNWQWVKEPTKNSKQSHTIPHPYYRNEDGVHSVTFKEAVRKHIFPAPADQAIPPEQLRALLKDALPRLPFDAYASALLDCAERLLGSDKIEVRADLRRAILREAKPEDVFRWLDQFLRLEAEAGNPKPVETVEAWVRESRLADTVLNEFRKRPYPLFIRNWQVIGPLPESSKLENDTAVESDEIHVERTYQGLQGKIGWKPLQAPSDRIDLGKLFAGKKSGVTYAGCWVHSKVKQFALLKLTNADRARVWIHSGSKYRIVIDEPFFRDGGTASNLAQIELSSGWNEILVLLESRSGRWNFSLELRNKDNSQPLTEVLIQAQPPKKEEKEKDKDQ